MKNLINKIKKVTKALLDLAYRAEEAVSLSFKALFEKDELLAKKVLNGDDRIDSLENKVDRMCLNIFALNQPVAIDLRCVLMISKIDTDYERIADLATVIATRTIDIVKKGKGFKIYPEEKLKAMALLVQKSIKDANECYVQEDVELAKEIIIRDQEINQLHNDLVREVIKKAGEDNENIRYYVDIIDIIKCMERIGDHVSNIAEDVIFIETGEIVRHKKF